MPENDRRRRRPAVHRRAITAITAITACTIAAVPMACGDDDDGGGATTTIGGVLPPVVADLSSIDGSTVEVPVGGVVDLTGGGDAVTEWSADIVDESIVTFVAGRDDGSATFDPGLTALAAGSTEVTMENSSTGDAVTFTVDVTEG